jgi:hypothetical protein
VYSKAADIVRVSLELGDFFMGIVIENTELVIVGSSDEPVFTCDEFDATYWNI